jgi:tetratricopeptide (TPR) repeat protein
MNLTQRLPSTRLVASLFVLVSILAVPTLAQTPPVWGNLEPGPFTVGFSTIEHYDYSRTLLPAKDYFGEPIEGVTARPIQACYWYPSAPATDPTPMVYGEYAFPYPENADFFDLLGTLQNQELGTLFFFMDNNQGLVLNSMNTEFYAVRDATQAEGSFPLIVYHHDARSGFGQNAVMCEYLASHGYVVVATHALGTSDIAVSESDEDILSAVRDREVAVALMREVPAVDFDKIGLLGVGNGGTAALIHQMSNFSVDAVATLQADFQTAEGFERLGSQTFYDPMKMQAPWLQLYADDPRFQNDLSALDSLEFSQRYSAHLTSVSFMELMSYRLMGVLQVPDTARSFETISNGYNTVCGFMLNFFDAKLKANETSQAWLDSDFDPAVATMTTLSANRVPPTEAQFASMIRSHGIEFAQEVCDEFDLTNPDHPIMTSNTFTGLGYQFLQRGQADIAMVIFEWGVTAFPTVANSWDSFGEACAAAGQTEQALSNYRKALELLPIDTTLTDAFRENLANGIPTTIEQLEAQLAEEARTIQTGSGE